MAAGPPPKPSFSKFFTNRYREGSKQTSKIPNGAILDEVASTIIGFSARVGLFVPISLQ
ncbi:protein of unknown function [Paraburkholderia kururiensis]